MGWRDQYQQGSFRGAAFRTVDHSAEIGRRGETFEFPERDLPWREDLGRAARRWKLRVFVVGDDYMAARDALIAAIEAPGPGALVHPWLGTVQAAIDGQVTITESTEEGGIAHFDLAFVEAGAIVPPTVGADTQGQSSAAADQAAKDATDRFGGAFEAMHAPPHVQIAAVARAAQIGALIGRAAHGLSGATDVLRRLNDGIALVRGAQSLLGLPARFADNLLRTIGAIADLGGGPHIRARAVLNVAAEARALPMPPASTPARAREAANAQALADLVDAGAAAALTRIAATASFESNDQAIALRGLIADALDDVAVAAADRGNDALADELNMLRRAVIADITARGGSLERLFAYQPTQVTPALVIAWRLYRDRARVIEQAAAIVGRNRIAHPGFVPARPLSVLTRSAAGG